MRIRNAKTTRPVEICQPETRVERPTGLSGPMGNPLFRLLWIATLISNTGSWLHQVADGWLMTTLSKDPFLVSMVQVLATLPMFLLALPAGTLSDLFDRRRYLLFTQSWMLVASATMGFLTWQGWMTPTVLLVATFLMSVGVALNSPGWHAVTPEVVPREQLPSAVILNGMAINCAQALGPALGGAVVLYYGPAIAFYLNSLSFLSVIVVLSIWKRQPQQVTSREGFFSAIRRGVQHVVHSPWLRPVLFRAALFLLCASSMWALMPILCREAYGFGPTHYGGLLALFGLGAVVGALKVLPLMREHWELDRIVTSFWVLLGLSLLGLSQGQTMSHAGICLFVAGISWLCVLSNCHFVVQSSAPSWVQGRAMSVYLLFFFGAATSGSAIWGLLARQYGLREAMFLSGAALLVTSLSRFIAPLTSGHAHNLDPSHAWEDPDVALEVPLAHGPVMVTVEYEIDQADAVDFRRALEKLRAFRYQNGVLQWNYYVDIADPRRYREVYFEESWGAHLRQHERVTSHERDVASEVYAFHRGEGMPRVFHHAVCNQNFPAQTLDVSEHEPTDDQGVPLWFITELAPGR